MWILLCIIVIAFVLDLNILDKTASLLWNILAFILRVTPVVLFYMFFYTIIIEIFDSFLLRVVITLVLIGLTYLSPVGLALVSSQLIALLVVASFPIMEKLYFQIPAVIVIPLVLVVPLYHVYKTIYRDMDLFSELYDGEVTIATYASVIPAVFIYGVMIVSLISDAFARYFNLG